MHQHGCFSDIQVLTCNPIGITLVHYTGNSFISTIRMEISMTPTAVYHNSAISLVLKVTNKRSGKNNMLKTVF